MGPSLENPYFSDMRNGIPRRMVLNLPRKTP